MKPFNSRKTLACVIVIAVSLSIFSALPVTARTQLLAQGQEVQMVGGSKCAAAWGMGLALAAASLSPCGVVCASLAWYDLALIGAYCD